MKVVAPHLAWPETERRARLKLLTFSPPHSPDAKAHVRLWRWFSLGTWFTWALFRLDDGDYVVRARWERGEAGGNVVRSQLPQPVAALDPEVFLYTSRIPAGLLDETLRSLREHLDATAVEGIVLDGTDCGFEIFEGTRRGHVIWTNDSIRTSTMEVFSSYVERLDALFK